MHTVSRGVDSYLTVARFFKVAPSGRIRILLEIDNDTNRPEFHACA